MLSKMCITFQSSQERDSQAYRQKTFESFFSLNTLSRVLRIFLCITKTAKCFIPEQSRILNKHPHIHITSPGKAI